MLTAIRNVSRPHQQGNIACYGTPARLWGPTADVGLGLLALDASMRPL
jgi:hypothetical protein